VLNANAKVKVKPQVLTLYGSTDILLTSKVDTHAKGKCKPQVLILDTGAGHRHLTLKTAFSVLSAI
jgi:hypothetical protein